jgi:peptide/nickel transport system ATP-binding protein
MQNGRCVERGPVRDIFRRPAREYTRRLLDSIPVSAKPTPHPPADAGVLLRVDGLRVRYAREAGLFQAPPAAGPDAVGGVSLEVRRGEILGLVGESGSGKSTLARAVVRLVEPAAGTVHLDRLEVSSLAPERLRAVRPRMQMVFQDPYSSLDPRMTVHDCIDIALRRRGVAARDQRLRDIGRLLAAVGLDPADSRKYPHEFSGGQRQRIAIARVLALDPELIIADEPVSALDVTVQAQILRLLLELNRERGLSMIFISHDLSVIRHVADRTAVMYRGRLLEMDDTETLFANPAHPYTRALLSAIPIPDPDRERNRRRIAWSGDGTYPAHDAPQ